jgi:hypothetical protein
MKKLLLIAIASLGLAFASCSKDEQEPINPQSRVCEFCDPMQPYENAAMDYMEGVVQNSITVLCSRGSIMGGNFSVIYQGDDGYWYQTSYSEVRGNGYYNGWTSIVTVRINYISAQSKCTSWAAA